MPPPLVHGTKVWKKFASEFRSEHGQRRTRDARFGVELSCTHELSRSELTNVINHLKSHCTPWPTDNSGDSVSTWLKPSSDSAIRLNEATAADRMLLLKCKSQAAQDACLVQAKELIEGSPALTEKGAFVLESR